MIGMSSTLPGTESSPRRWKKYSAIDLSFEGPGENDTRLPGKQMAVVI
jgi:hypothetical protein